MSVSNSDFTADEVDLIEQARREHEAEGQGSQDGANETQEQQAAEQVSEQPGTGQQQEQTQQQQPSNAEQSQAAQAAATAAQAPAQPEQPDRSAGDLRDALRASRRGEKRAREELARTQQELETLRAAAPAPKPAGISAEQLAEIEQDYPTLAPVVKHLNTQVQEMTQKRPAPAPAQQQEFVPVALPEEVQDVVDTIPDLLTWQLDPNQQHFQLAIQADNLLLASPRWQSASDAERLAEVVRIVKEQTGSSPAAASAARTPAPPPQQPNPVDAARKVIANATANNTPVAIGDLRGGAAPSSNDGPDYSRMTDEQIMASLPR